MMTKRALWLGMALLISSVVWGVDYQYVGATAGKWDCGTNWTGGSGTDYPDDAGDTADVGNGATVDAEVTVGSTITAGEFIIRNGSGFVCPGYKNMTYILDDSGGKSGNWWWASATEYSQWGVDVTVDLDGNFYQMSPYSFTYGGYKGLIKMRGNDKAIKHLGQNWTSNVNYEIYGQRVWDNGSTATGNFIRTYVNVMPGGSIAGNAAVTGVWTARSYGFPNGQANLPALKEKVNFGYGFVIGEDNSPGKLAITSGVMYPLDVMFNGDWMGAVGARWTPEYEFKLKRYAPGQSANLGVGRDLKISGGTYSFMKLFVNTLENGTNNSAALTVKRNLIVADIYNFNYGTQTLNQYQGIRLNNSQVNIGGNFVVGAGDGSWDGWFPRNSGAIDLGNATVNVGGNFTVYRMNRDARLLWNRNNNSTMIFDGNGTTATQTIRIYGDDGMAANEHTPLHNVVIRTKGTVQLDPYTWGGMAAGWGVPPPSYAQYQDNAFRNTVLVLTGDLRIDCGTFQDNNRHIIFNGPEHYLQIAPGATLNSGAHLGFFDNLVLLPNAVLYLLSNVKADNLDMKSGSQLYLNGFHLMADGMTFDHDNPAGQWVHDSVGTIFGDAIPEPGTLLLLGTGALGALGWLRRRRVT